MNRSHGAFTVAWLLPVLWCCGGCSGPDTDTDHASDSQAEVVLDAATEILPDTSPETTQGDTTDSMLEAVPDTAGVDAVDTPVLRHLTPDEYTNEPIVVGMLGMGFTCEGLGSSVTAVKLDDRGAVLHGVVEEAPTGPIFQVADGNDLLDVEGTQVLWEVQELTLSSGEILFGNGDALGPLIVGTGSCPRILVTESNILYEGQFGDSYCRVPFIHDGVTYLAMLGMEFVGYCTCVPWWLSPGAEVYLFVRYSAEEDRTHIIVPYIVQEGVVVSPCCPGSPDPQQFEDTLMYLLAAETE